MCIGIDDDCFLDLLPLCFVVLLWLLDFTYFDF